MIKEWTTGIQFTNGRAKYPEILCRLRIVVDAMFNCYPGIARNEFAQAVQEVED
jgi:hypothetical protein